MLYPGCTPAIAAWVKGGLGGAGGTDGSAGALRCTVGVSLGLPISNPPAQFDPAGLPPATHTEMIVTPVKPLGGQPPEPCTPVVTVVTAWPVLWMTKALCWLFSPSRK